jgi:hypothetical protein
VDDLHARDLDERESVERVREAGHERAGALAVSSRTSRTGQARGGEGEERARVVGEHGIAGHPGHGRDHQRFGQEVIAESEAVPPGVEAVGLEEGPRAADELVGIPRDHVGEVDGIAGVREDRGRREGHRPHPQEGQRCVAEQRQQHDDATSTSLDQHRASEPPMIS